MADDLAQRFGDFRRAVEEARRARNLPPSNWDDDDTLQLWATLDAMLLALERLAEQPVVDG
jgi:hypothetical protein